MLQNFEDTQGTHSDVLFHTVVLSTPERKTPVGMTQTSLQSKNACGYGTDAFTLNLFTCTYCRNIIH